MSGASLTTVILDEIRQLLESRRALLDRADDLGELTIDVKLMAGTPVVKSVSISELRVRQRTAR